MLDVKSLDIFIAGKPLLLDVCFKLTPGETVSLVGANGSGKSTLLKGLAGEITPDSGEIGMPKECTIGYLPQHAEMDTSRTLIEELRWVFKEALLAEQELEEVSHRLGELDPASEAFEKACDRMGHLQHELDRLNVYEMDANIARICDGLGFHNDDLERKCEEFSGGWRMRILLARLLLHNHDVLLLDEPTNHLDLETMIWLEDWIRDSDSTVLMVSHERAFMDNLSDRVFEIHEGKLTIYRTNYTGYLAERQERWAQWAREYENQQEEIKRTERFIERFRAKATKAVQVQSRVKQLEKIVRIPPPPKEAGSIHFRFPDPDRSSKEIFTGQHLVKAYGALKVLDDVDLEIWRGERIAIIGLNGAGKSTLMKIMDGREQPTSGTFRRGPIVSTEYFAQYDTEDVSPANTVFNEVNSVAPLGSEQQVRNLLGGFFFRGDDVDKKIEVLSGGERTRVRLARMLFSGANTLLLDEPTNHLDLASRRTLEQAMCEFPGTLIFVSHDRVFLEKVPTRILEVKNGKLRSFKGNYTEYCHALRLLGEESPLMEHGSKRRPHDKQGAGKGKEFEPAPAAPPPLDLTLPDHPRATMNITRDQRKVMQRDRRKVEKDCTDAERRIAAAEERLAEIEQSMAQREVYTNSEHLAELGAEQKRIRTDLDRQMAEWEALQSKLQSMPEV